MSHAFTTELLEAAKKLKSPEEIAVMAKEQGFEITTSQAAAFLGMDTKKLADEELENVAGGACLDQNELKRQANLDGRPHKFVRDLWFDECPICLTISCVFAATKEFKKIKNERDYTLYTDCKCYACGKHWKDLRVY